MEVYFIRHGETDGNRAKRHQHIETPLNERGIAQAQAVAKTIASISPTHILSSPFVRTMQTTRIISASYNSVIPSVSNLFAELIRPNELTGSRFFALDTIQYLWNWFNGTKTKTGESYADLRERVKNARALLESLPADARVVVISHSVFINFFVAHLCDDRPITITRAALLLRNIFAMKNTSVTTLHFDHSTSHACGWSVKHISHAPHLK